MLARMQPAAIILDLYLAGQNCAGHVRELRASPETETVPIVVISVMDGPRTGLAFGADKLLRKPVNQDVFCSTPNEAFTPTELRNFLLKANVLPPVRMQRHA
jgi:DNA-binding response OmpR family regulator